MFGRLRALIGETSGPVPPRRDRLQLATAALLMEAARMDGGVERQEEAHLEELLRDRFGLDSGEAAELVEAAHAHSEESVQLHGIAEILRNRLDEDERVEIVEMMWEVVYADGELHHLEANLLRRMAGLLYVSDRDSGLARQRALARLGIAGEAKG